MYDKIKDQVDKDSWTGFEEEFEDKDGNVLTKRVRLLHECKK